jgi:Ser-tRNA(Ala) deacylase AlaX
MTKQLFYEDAYLKGHKARVSKVEGSRVLLEETILFPQTSTEPGDVGRINGFKILGLKKEGAEIWHVLNTVPSFKEGDLVDLEVDWNRRYKTMRLHSALHLWAGVFEAKFNERAVAGVVKSDAAYLVFKHELADEVIQKSLEQANMYVQAELGITTYEDEVRQGFKWCRIGEYVPIPCAGLHVRNTKEIGPLTCTQKALEGQKQKLVLKID